MVYCVPYDGLHCQKTKVKTAKNGEMRWTILFLTGENLFWYTMPSLDIAKKYFDVMSYEYPANHNIRLLTDRFL